MENRRTIPTRRLSDLDFKSCPKYITHDLSEDQILSIAKKAVELAKEEAKLELADNVIAFGKDAAGKLFFIIGAIMIGVVAWAQTHNIRL